MEKSSKIQKTIFGCFNKDILSYDFDLNCVKEYEGKGLTSEIYNEISKKIEKESEIEKYEKIFPNKSYFPSCTLEFYQSKEIEKLRKSFDGFCDNYANLKNSPKESFNRWLFKILSSQDKIRQTIIPVSYNLDYHNKCFEVLKNEIYAEIPFRLQKNKRRTVGDCIKQGKRVLNFLSPNGEFYIYFRKDMEDVLTEDKIKEYSNFFYEFKKYFNNNFKRNKNIREFNQKFEKFFNFSKRFIKSLFENTYLKHMKDGSEEVVGIMKSFSKNFRKEVERVIKTLEDIKLEKNKSDSESVNINENEDEERAEISFSIGKITDKVSILMKHYKKLKALYGIHVKIDPNLKSFNKILYCLVRRYKTFFGKDDQPLGEGASFHAACLESVFKYMKNHLKVNCELFASPLNCYFPRFCSAFADIDVFFGSWGSFDYFLKNLKKGSFEVGPPYTIEVQEYSANCVEELLKRNENPLSFVFFVAEWRNPVAKYHLILENSKFTKLHFELKPYQHSYISGGQHIPEKHIPEKKKSRKRKRKRKELRRIYVVPHGTHVYILQNEKGEKEYKIPNSFREDVEKLFKNQFI